jgi:hypothetical protein
MSQEFHAYYSTTSPRTIIIKSLNKINKIALVFEAVDNGSKVSARFQPTTSLDAEVMSRYISRPVYGVIGVVQIDRGSLD